MQPITVKFKDPEYDTIEIPIEEDVSPEALKEVTDFLNENTRETWASDRKYHRHNYSLESRVFEGMDYAYRKTPEWICIRKEEFEERMRTLAALTETQRRRLKMLFVDKLSLREIARAEGVDYKSVVDSIGAAARKLAPLMDSEITCLPDFDYHYGPKHREERSEDSNFQEKSARNTPSKQPANVRIVRGT